jgi:hypothetical protein
MGRGACSRAWGGSRGRGRVCLAARKRSGPQVRDHTTEQLGVGTDLRHRDPDPANGDADPRPDLQQPRADRAAQRLRHVGAGKADAPQRFEQQVGDRREVEPRLVGADELVRSANS